MESNQPQRQQSLPVIPCAYSIDGKLLCIYQIVNVLTLPRYKATKRYDVSPSTKNSNAAMCIYKRTSILL